MTISNVKCGPDEPVTPNQFSLRENRGLTKREYFAAVAMQGLYANPNAAKIGKPMELNHVATVAVFAADALLEELNK